MIRSLILAFFPVLVFSQDFTVRINNLDEIIATASNSSALSNQIYVEKPVSGGLGNSENDAVQIFIGMDGSEVQQNSFAGSNPSLLPGVSPLDTFFSTELIFSNLTINDMYVNVAVKSGDSYTSFKLIDDAILVSANTELTTSINLKFSDLCDEVSSEYSLQGEDSLKESIKIYFYLSNTQDSSTSVTVNEGGLFFDLNISNRLPENFYELSSLDAGDERAFMQIKNGASITQMGDDLLEGRVMSYVSSVEQVANSYVGSGASSLKIILKSELLDEGEVAVNELVNNTTYNLSLAKINKYYFFFTPFKLEIGDSGRC